MTETDRLWESHKKIEALEREIRRLKKVQSELAESEEKYRLLVDNANDAIFIVQNGDVQFPNERGREIGRRLGLQLERVPFIEYVHPDDRELVVDRHLRRLRGEDLPHTYSFRLVGGQGQEIWVALNAVRINWQGRPATLNFLRDITAQKELEARLGQVRTLEALGTMAGGMAHDFNNLLMSIRADATALQLQSDNTARHQEMVKGILHAVSSGEAMTRQLLGFARKDTCKLIPTDLNRLLAQTIAMFKGSRKGLRVHTDFEDQLWTVDADSVQLERVLLNLLVNAGQAMPGGGDINLATRNETLDRKRALELGLSQGQYVRVSVADNGPGMDAATLERVFEPFFTTKKKGNGSGLGLACAFGIVESHRGRLVASSQKGAGACFDIFLPVSAVGVCAQIQAEGAEPELVCLPAELGWLRTVLLVDDNHLLATAVSLMLEKQGVRVLRAESLEAALALLEARPDEIDLVILDMVLPGIDGQKALDQMRARAPGARFMLTGGCGPDDSICRLLNRGGVGFIQKPYDDRELYQKIQEAFA